MRTLIGCIVGFIGSSLAFWVSHVSIFWAVFIAYIAGALAWGIIDSKEEEEK